MNLPKVFVIMGSVRARRLCPDIAHWIAGIAREMGPHVELVDLQDWPLPMDEEPSIPATGRYTSEHTLTWSRKVREADAFIFVTPQYNWGYPAPLKNALDHLYNEWAGKPAMIVTYGGHGGDKCGMQLVQVLTGLKMKPIASLPQLKLSHQTILDNPGSIDAAFEFGSELGTITRALSELLSAI